MKGDRYYLSRPVMNIFGESFITGAYGWYMIMKFPTGIDMP
jgi:hypothetical protein